MQTNNVYILSIAKRVNIYGESIRVRWIQWKPSTCPSVSMYGLVSYEQKLCISDFLPLLTD